MNAVHVWEEEVVIPTYEIGEPEKNPIFLEKRVYQGSSGVVYPHPVVEKIADCKVDKKWQAVFLENRYLKIMILPQLGGRVQMAYDKVKQRHFVYYNQVIKPALVGLTGPWISGGIEFNWPQHHRPSTYEPVDYALVENEDGSKTVWCSEVERMFRTKGMAGFTLHPDKAYLEIKVQLYNRTAQPQTFLWWANPAVKVNDHYQSVFPPDVHAVFDHGKRDVSSFPIAKGTYYKVDYSKGVDISRYKNIPVPTSYMAIVSDYDFVGGYENDSRGGLLHVANHHVSPGKKQWTWGNGDFGQAWDRNLTDEDGPYIELMCGVYTDNQPDFSWLMPYEEKSFSQFFMPYQELGMVKNATKEALLNFEVKDGKATLKVYTTAEYEDVHILVQCNGKTIWEKSALISPEKVFLESFEVVEKALLHAYDVQVSHQGKTLVAWQPEEQREEEIPEPAQPAKEPKDISSNEQLFLTGQHLEQYRHATYDAADYYKEALRRDPKDYRCNNALGLYFFKKGRFEKSLPYFQQAVATQTERNPNPYDGEPFFNLGQVYLYLGMDDLAYQAFHKSVWNAAWADSGYFHLAQLSLKFGNLERALEEVNRSLDRNARHHKAWHLKVVILRKLGRNNEAKLLADQALQLDLFNMGVRFEKWLLSEEEKDHRLFDRLIRDHIHTHIEYALDYAHAGQYQEAISLLERGISKQSRPYPMALYFIALWTNLEVKPAQQLLESAAAASPDYCFPNRLEEVLVLQYAMEAHPADPAAPYYLGNFWYHHRQYEEAVSCWEKSVQLQPEFPTAHRNLALAYYNKLGKKAEAIAAMEKAFNLQENDPRLLMELDQLYKKENRDITQRLAFLEQYMALVLERDDLYLELSVLHNLRGNYQKAYELIMQRKFHPWEGGEGKVTGQYVLALLGMGVQAIAEAAYSEAIDCFSKALVFPENLGEGKLYGACENDIHYFLGCAYEGAGERNKAEEAWREAARGDLRPASVWFYNDQQPDKICYQGLALRKLGQDTEASKKFAMLLAYGEKHINDEVKIDYFAVSMPDLLIWEEDIQIRNQVHCRYLMALGFWGKGEERLAQNELEKVLDIHGHHEGANFHYRLMEEKRVPWLFS